MTTPRLANRPPTRSPHRVPTTEAATAITHLSKARVLVVANAMRDRSIFGSAERPSPGRPPP